MINIREPKFATRQEIADYYEISVRTLTDHLKLWKEEIEKIYPEFKRGGLIPPIVFRLIHKKFTGEEYENKSDVKRDIDFQNE